MKNTKTKIIIDPNSKHPVTLKLNEPKSNEAHKIAKALEGHNATEAFSKAAASVVSQDGKIKQVKLK